MTRRLFAALSLAAAALTTGCAALETSASSPLTPSTTTVQIPSLVGTWTSNTLSTVGSSCTNFQWRVTGQSMTSLSGEFSADCVGGISVWGTIAGTLNGQEVPYTVNGIATVTGGIACPVMLVGTARLEGGAIRIPYEGTSCLGPIRGEEVLRKPATPEPAPVPTPTPAPTPAPVPEPPPPPSSNGYHVGPGALTIERAREIVNATSREWAPLIGAKHSEAESIAGAQEMLLRMIWHLQLAGYQAGRQRNPSGAISNDKLTVFAEGAWHAYDVFYDLGAVGKPTQVIWWDLGNAANYMPDGGIAD